MDDEYLRKLRTNYLTACGSSVVAAFLCVLLYPSKHGLSDSNRTIIVVVSLAMLGLFVWIINTSRKRHELDEPHEHSPSNSVSRLKKMSFLWFGFGVLLSASLLRYAITDFLSDGAVRIFPQLVGAIMGSSIIVFNMAKLIALIRSGRS